MDEYQEAGFERTNKVLQGRIAILMSERMVARNGCWRQAVKTGSGEGVLTGLSSRRRILRLPAARRRYGIGFTRNLLGVATVGTVWLDPMYRISREIAVLFTSHLTLINCLWRRAGMIDD